MAFQCLRLSLTANNDHAESFCNLAVLEMRKGNIDQVSSYLNDILISNYLQVPFSQAKTLLQTAMKFGDYTFEPFYNYALLCYQCGELQASYIALKKSLEIFPEHPDSKELMRLLKLMFTAL